MDLVHDYGYPLPITVICDMLGVPHDRRDRLLDGSAYIADLVAEKRRHPGDDLLSQLVRMEAAGDHLDEHELRAMVRLLIFAGHETTANLISIGVLTLFDHPDALARLQADPNLIPGAIEELLRFNGPVLTPVPRFARDDVELGGQRIRRGDLVLVSLGSANHDEAAFTDPKSLVCVAPPQAAVGGGHRPREQGRVAHVVVRAHPIGVGENRGRGDAIGREAHLRVRRDRCEAVPPQERDGRRVALVGVSARRRRAQGVGTRERAPQQRAAHTVAAPGRVDSHDDVGVRVPRPFQHEAMRDQAFRPPRLLDDPAVLPRIVAGPRHRLAYGLLTRILVRAIDRLDRRKEVCQSRRVILRTHGTHGDIRLARSVGHSSTPPRNTRMPSGAYPQCTQSHCGHAAY